MQATRASRPDTVAYDIAVELVRTLLRLKVQENRAGRHDLRAKENYGVSYWDAAIVAAARALEQDRATA